MIHKQINTICNILNKDLEILFDKEDFKFKSKEDYYKIEVQRFLGSFIITLRIKHGNKKFKFAVHCFFEDNDNCKLISKQISEKFIFQTKEKILGKKKFALYCRTKSTTNSQEAE